MVLGPSQETYSWESQLTGSVLRRGGESQQTKKQTALVLTGAKYLQNHGKDCSCVQTLN